MIHLSSELLLLQYCYLFIINFSNSLSPIYIFIFIILSSPFRYSSVNVVLIFNDSLIILAPSAPILLSVRYQLHFPLLPIYIFIFIILSSPLRSSVVNEVLIFNDSLIIFAPSAPILLPVHYLLL